MRVVRMVVATLVFGLGAMGASAATPASISPAITVNILPPSAGDDIAQIISSGSSWLVVGNVDKSTIADSKLFPSEPSRGESDGYVTMLDPALNLIWSHRFGTSHDDVATAITRDSDGVIWSVGVTTKEVQPVPTASPSPSIATPVPTVNPDGVSSVASPSAPAVAGQLLVASWSSSGQLLSQNLYPIADGVAIDPTAIVAGKSGIYVVGTAVAPTTGISQGFYLSVGKDGTIGQVHWLGTNSVVLRAAALLGNGSLVVAGSIAEALKGKPAIGPVDAFIAVVNPTTGAVLRTQRSGNRSATRSWESVNADRAGNLMATGFSLGSKSEAVATFFGPTGAVKFSLRMPEPLGTEIALPAPSGAIASIALATSRPAKSYLAPIGAGGRLMAPTYLAGKAGTGLVAAAAGKGYLLAVGQAEGLTLVLFPPRSGK